ncbi:MAG TPA: hypothetical protein VL984_03230 [Acidimicrobiales bacterium]|nr:hypothetical protein [Acidimicrobiales bacterium]
MASEPGPDGTPDRYLAIDPSVDADLATGPKGGAAANKASRGGRGSSGDQRGSHDGQRAREPAEPEGGLEAPGEAVGTDIGLGASGAGNGAPYFESQPQTGAWSFGPEQDDEGEQYPDWGEGSSWRHGEPREWADDDPQEAVQAGEGWYEADQVEWEGPNGTWYGQEYYPDGYAPYSGQTSLPPGALPTQLESYGYAPVPVGWGNGAAPGIGARGPRRSSGPWPELVMVAAVAVIIAAVILAVSSANKTNRPANGLSSAPSVTSAGAAVSPTVSAAPPTSASHPPTSSPTSAPPRTATTHKTTAAPAGKAQALPVTLGVEQSLVKSWLATDPGGVGLSAKDVAGTVPGQVYYGRQPGSPPLYWALAAFQPSSLVSTEQSTAAGQDALAQFQDSVYVFDWKSGPYWTELGYVSSGECPGSYVPTAMLTAWALCGE